jgi:predicted CXXCH cytochrome family protein
VSFTVAMKGVTRIIVCGLLVAGLSLYGCAPKTRYKVLSFFFDGMPNPEMPVKKENAGKQNDEMSPMRAVTYRMHGPYAARMCNGCHTPGSNVLILPPDKLCFRCHKLDLSKKYVHGPVAAGGCLKCHDPHGSAYPYFLVADPATFCLRCHDKKDIAKNEAHKGIEGQQCTTCHDAHSSDKEYLLK